MKNTRFEFLIDESGSFEDSAPSTYRSAEASLVGGLLVDAGYLTDKRVETLLPEHVHCCESDTYDKERCLSVLETLKTEGARFVIFENKERISILNGDTTYLNIISEGLVKLFSDLALEYPEGQVSVDVTIALRKNVAAGRGIIYKEEYERRLEEKLLLAAHRENKSFCSYKLFFEDARTYRPLDFADIICNTFLTKGRKKFTDVQKARIAKLYDPKYIYPVFEAATVGYLKRLLSEEKYGEMLLEICTLPNLTGVTKLKELLIKRLADVSAAEFDACMSYMSLQIGLCNNTNLFAKGIALAENYKKYFLSELSENTRLHSKVDFWIFDTDFYILTMYDHVGNLDKCSEYTEECRKRLHSINHSWEHLEYYFRYRIRELNVLMGRFEFENVLSLADELISILTNAKELFGLIETFDNTATELRSELLGKVYGIKLEAYINMLGEKPELFEEALEMSDLALAEFSEQIDINRQYHYRCLLMTTAGKTKEALDCLLRIYGIDADSEEHFSRFVDIACAKQNRLDEFALWHYLDVLLLVSKTDKSTAENMAAAVLKNRVFCEALSGTEKHTHPWHLVIWKLGKWYYSCGSINAGDSCYKAALDAVLAEKEKITMRSFAVSIEADWVLQKWQNSLSFKHAKNLQSIQRQLDEMPGTMRMHFLGREGGITEADLQRLSRAYLK